MTQLQTQHLLEQISGLTRELEVARQQIAHAETLRVCCKKSPDRPLQEHGSAKVCATCFDALRSEFVQTSLVIGSIRSLVQERMRRGQECPFCGQLKRHTDACYLHTDAGFQLLAEYSAIEQHRDLLLEERERDRLRVPTCPNGTARTHSLKDRARHNGHPQPPPS